MFKLHSNFKPTGDQPEAILKLVDGIKNGFNEQILMGVTGSGKTYTIANVISKINKPTLVLAHNKTLAGQLYNELKELFPENRVEYFISYYDYYQPEAYIASTDTYIEKDASINDEIDEMRHKATHSLMTRDDCIVVASVSCIYGIGDPIDYKENLIFFRKNDCYDRNEILLKLVMMQYERNDIDFKRGTFRIRGDLIDIIPAYEKNNGIRLEFFDNELESIKEFDILTGKLIRELEFVTIYPASHFVTNKQKLEKAISLIEEELDLQIKYFESNDKPLEKERITMRTKYDIEMLRETGSCSGVENYSRHLSLRKKGEAPSTLIDFFPKDFLLIVDESHVTLPQVRGMYNGDQSRKKSLVDYGFRLPSALDNRPLTFSEFEKKINNVIYVSATPGDYEINKNIPVVEQIIRPTGLLDPIIEVRKTKGQIDDLVFEINKRIENNERILITTLTIKMSEDLTDYLKKMGYKVAYLHSKIKSLERMNIIRELRLKKYDILVGINLLREGLDIPEVSLIAIFDADKQGFLRSDRSLIQTVGRAARNKNGKVIMYADTISTAMKNCIDETLRRRNIQDEYNKLNNIIPTTIIKNIQEPISLKTTIVENEKTKKRMTIKEKNILIKDIEKQMLEAAKNLNFEEAAELRDILFELKNE